ncbi:hypothetical protein KSF78_0007891 [Schistosoma japonicum]|nr:hypothetical protein KSF78_0007891 [Schistosoma japonicum]KAH8873082.1 hypothetical protein KSF78_0007891 [Schistosoma japonicum]
MDTSMEDLFSDFDKSTLLIEADTKKNNTEKRDLVVFTTETIGNEMIQIEGVYQASTQSLCLNIKLHQNSLSIGCINLEIPCHQYPASSTYVSDMKNILPIQICTLCDKNYFVSITTCSQHNKSVVFDDLSSTSPSSSSIFACSKQFISILCDNSTPDLIRLCGFPNGIIYAIWFSTITKQLNCSVVAPLSCCKPIIAWGFIRNPAPTTTGTTVPSVNDLLIGLTKDGEGIGVWYDSLDEEVCNKKDLNITEFNLPQPPDPITKCHPQGSWLHVITQSGYLMSIHFSLQLKQFTDECNNQMKSKKLNLICQPTNFPRLPIHLSPVTNIEQWIKSCPKWRNLNVYDFARLADGHLGSVDSRGCKTRLVDLLSKPENLSELDVSYTEQQLNQTFMNLIKTKHQMKIYLACLLLLNRISRLMNTDETESSHFPLDCKVYLTHPTSYELENKSPLELIVDITVSGTTTIGDGYQENGIDELLHSDLTKINLNYLTHIILFPSYLNKTNKNCIISDYLKEYLYIVVTIEVVNRSDCELLSTSKSSPSSNKEEFFCESDNHMVSNHSVVYTHKELWFDFSTNINNSKTRRCIIPSNWLHILDPSEMNHDASTSQQLINNINLDGIQVYVKLEFQSPILPYICFNQFSQQEQQAFLNVKNFDRSPISVTITHCFFDCIHLLYPIKSNNSTSKNIKNENSMELMLYMMPTMHINISDSVFQSILSDIFKNTSSCSKNHEDFLKLIISSHNGRQFYSCLTCQSVKFQWSVNLDLYQLANNDNDEETNKVTCNSNHKTWCFTISSICLKTLWFIYNAVELRQKISQKTNPVESFKPPTVEELRLECSILKKLLTSLRNIQSNNNGSSNDKFFTEKLLLSEPKYMANYLLDSYSVIRKTMSSRLFCQ